MYHLISMPIAWCLYACVGKTEMELNVFDRQVVNHDSQPRTYTIAIDKSGGCQYDKLAVTLVWSEPGGFVCLLLSSCPADWL